MNLAEYERLKQQAELDYRQNLAAIERTWRLSQQINGKEPAKPSADETKTHDEEEQVSAPFNRAVNRVKGNLIEAIRVAIAGYTEEFTILEVESSLQQMYPSWSIKRVSIHATLMRLVEKGELEIDVRGSGRRPTIYRKT